VLSKTISDAYLSILREELVPALGCTEPIAVALAAAKARQVLGAFPERIEMRCSGNVVKNVKGVVVPNTGGLKGIEAAAIAGALVGDREDAASRGLEVLEGLSRDALGELTRLLAARICSVCLAEGIEGLYIEATALAGEDRALARIEGAHTNFTAVLLNGRPVDAVAPNAPSPAPPRKGGALEAYASLLNIRDILEFAESVEIAQVEPIISEQMRMNRAISDEGLAHPYGADVGKTLLKCRGNDLRTRAAARPAAGSDARMSGCSMPVVINSGSGNQGMTVCLPVMEYAAELEAPPERLYRALVLSNLVSIHHKSQIGKLSAYCGAVSAACGSGAGIDYLCGGDYESICRTITNTIANVGGIVCDGAKPSCAAKIASSVDAAIMAHDLAAESKVFAPGEGLVSGDVESTIANVSRMGRDGMRSTDAEILEMMIDNEPDQEPPRKN
jgi:Uncharacterized conserved protein